VLGRPCVQSRNRAQAFEGLHQRVAAGRRANGADAATLEYDRFPMYIYKFDDRRYTRQLDITCG